MYVNVQHPLIFQNIPLPELAPGAVFSIQLPVSMLKKYSTFETMLSTVH